MTVKKIFKKLSKKIVKFRLVTWLISLILYVYILLILHTTKWTINEKDGLTAVLKKHKQVIGISWHSRSPLLPFFWNRKYPLNALVSKHHDGRIVANLITLIGVKTIDGSTSSNATSSALNMVRILEKGESVAIIPDGPLGPRQRLSMSPIYLAQRTGVCILPVMYSVANAKIFKKSWDRMILPKPFSKGVALIGEPIFIPETSDKAKMEHYRKKVEDAMNELQYRADTLTGLPKIFPAALDEIKKNKRKKN